MTDVVAAGDFLQTADRLEESAGSCLAPGSVTLSQAQADSLLSSRETGEAEVPGSHQGDVGHLQWGEQPLGQPWGDPVSQSCSLAVGGEAGETGQEDQDNHFSRHEGPLDTGHWAQSPPHTSLTVRSYNHTVYGFLQ